MPEILPMSSMQQLSNDGISFIKKSSTKLCHHIIEINRLISDRINNCKSLFPIWINWAYIKELFIMPNGLTEGGTKDAADIYYASLSYYPYQMYINWILIDRVMSSIMIRSLLPCFINGIATPSRNTVKSLMQGLL